MFKHDSLKSEIFNGRNAGFDIARLDVATQVSTFSGDFSFQAKRTLSGHFELS